MGRTCRWAGDVDLTPTEHYATTTPPTCHQHWLREQNTATTNRPTNPEYLDKYPLVYTRTSSQVSSSLFSETVSVGAFRGQPCA